MYTAKYFNLYIGIILSLTFLTIVFSFDHHIANEWYVSRYHLENKNVFHCKFSFVLNNFPVTSVNQPDSTNHKCCGTNLLRLHHKTPWSQLCLIWKCFIEVNINCCGNEWIYTHKSKSKTLTGRHLLSHCRQIILPEWKNMERKKNKNKRPP